MTRKQSQFILNWGPCPPLSYATDEYCLDIFLFLGSEGVHGTVPPPPYATDCMPCDGRKAKWLFVKKGRYLRRCDVHLGELGIPSVSDTGCGVDWLPFLSALTRFWNTERTPAFPCQEATATRSASRRILNTSTGGRAKDVWIWWETVEHDVTKTWFGHTYRTFLFCLGCAPFESLPDELKANVRAGCCQLYRTHGWPNMTSQ